MLYVDRHINKIYMKWLQPAGIY